MKIALNPKAFGLAWGILWAIGMFILVLGSWMWDYGTDWVILMASFYKGIGPTPLGLLLAVLWAFLDGFIGGYLLAWLYNKLS